MFEQPFVDLKTLNKATAAKICLLKAFSEHYDFIFLDEIDSNFDQIAQKQYQDLLNLINDEAKTIVVSVSHQIEGSDLLCAQENKKN